MQRNPTLHVIQRFHERFNNQYLNSIKSFNTFATTKPKFDISDYQNLCRIYQNDNIGYNIIFIPKRNNKAKVFKKIIIYKNIPMWIVYTTKKRKVKTIYPLKNTQLKNFLI